VLLPEPTFTADLGGGATMEFVYVRKGTFWMGSPADEEGRGAARRKNR
jgi:hypothetical protein